MATILALDKDPIQLNLLGFLLREEGHRVYATGEPDTALSLLGAQLIDLIIVEILLRRQDGMHVCQRMRQLNPSAPLMILSECHDEQRIVEGLNVVADDYVTKPYSPRPLLARVQALLRRSSINRNGGYLEDDLSMGEITLNFHLMCVEANGHRVRLTQREFALLHCLMQNAGRVLTRDQIMRLAWGENFVGTAKCVDVNVQRLRNKIGPYLGNGFCIQALRGFGYKFETQGNSVRPIPTRPHVADSANPADDNYVFVTDGGGTKAGSGALSPA